MPTNDYHEAYIVTIFSIDKRHVQIDVEFDYFVRINLD